MIQISLVPSGHIDQIWDVVSPMLDKAVQRSNGRMQLMDLYHDLIDGEQTLWIALDDTEIIGCCTVMINKYGTGLTTLSYEYLGGADVGRWLGEGHRVLQMYAKEYGATRLEVPQGRKGWMPHLAKLGYRQSAIRYECELEEQDNGR